MDQLLSMKMIKDIRMITKKNTSAPTSNEENPDDDVSKIVNQNGIYRSSVITSARSSVIQIIDRKVEVGNNNGVGKADIGEQSQPLNYSLKKSYEDFYDEKIKNELEEQSQPLNYTWKKSYDDFLHDKIKNEPEAEGNNIKKLMKEEPRVEHSDSSNGLLNRYKDHPGKLSNSPSESFDMKLWQQKHQIQIKKMVNTPFNSLCKSVHQTGNNHKKANTAENDHEEHTTDVYRRVHIGYPEYRFTIEDLDLVDKLYDTMAECTKTLIRPELYQAIIDYWLGSITRSEMVNIIAQGKHRQLLLHSKVMASVPFYNELSKRYKKIFNWMNKIQYSTSSAKNFLMNVSAPVCMELFSAVFFFGHTGATLVEQADTCGIVTRFREYVQTVAPYATHSPAMNYESLYK